MRLDLGGGQCARVDRSLVELAGQVVAVPAPGAVATDPPVAVVGLAGGLGVAADQGAVDVEHHAVDRVLAGHHVVPGAVVVGRRAGDGVQLAGVDPEGQLAGVLHVDVPVVVVGVSALLVTEPDQLATVGGRGLEPDLLGVGRRVGEPGGRGHGAVRAVEGGGGAGRDVGAGAEGHATGHDAAGPARRGVGDGRAAGLVQPPVERRVVVVDGLAVRVGRGRRHVDRTAALRVVVADLGGAQRGRVDRDVVDGAGDVKAGRLVGPAVDVVPADPPVPGEPLTRGGARV